MIIDQHVRSSDVWKEDAGHVVEDQHSSLIVFQSLHDALPVSDHMLKMKFRRLAGILFSVSLLLSASCQCTRAPLGVWPISCQHDCCEKRRQ
jgi:hypothetical protein